MTGQDGLRDEIAAALTSLCVCEDEANHIEEADAVLPVVQAHIDAAVARAEAAEKAVQRVRELLARWEHTPGRMSQVDVLRRALDGAP